MPSRLTLTFRTGEHAKLTLPDGRVIEVYVASAEHGRVSLAFTTERDVKIDRGQRLSPADGAILSSG